VYPLVRFPALYRTQRFITCSHKNSAIFPFLNQTNAIQITLMWLALRQKHDYWKDSPERRRCVSLSRGRPLGLLVTLPSFLPSAAEIPRATAAFHQQTSHTRLAHRVQSTRSSVHETGTRPELVKSIVIEPTLINREPQRTVPEGRGPRLSCQVKADLKYGRDVYLHTSGFPTWKPYLRQPPLTQVAPSRA
jgi:hypothetical protein